MSTLIPKGISAENRAEWYVRRGHVLVSRTETLATEGLVSCFGLWITTGEKFVLAHVFDVKQMDWFMYMYRDVINNAVRIVVASSNPDHENYKSKLPLIQKLKNVEYVTAGSMVADLHNVVTTKNVSGDIYVVRLSSDNPSVVKL